MLQKKKEGGEPAAAATTVTEVSSAGDVGYHRRLKKTTRYSTDSVLPITPIRYAPPQTLGSRLIDIH